MSGVNSAFTRLSKDQLEDSSRFLVQVNMFRAGSNQEAIVMEDAVKYLRASKFNASKAIDIYKNYQKHRLAYDLDSMRPYREPLSSEIGTRKLEIVGSHDPEGAGLVVFTGARHDSKQSDIKAAMQLLFYTLDQLTESDSAQDSGVVFILDMRETHIDGIKYPRSMVTVLQCGYPIFVKMIYIVGAVILTKAALHFQKHTKVKFLNYEDLPKYFPQELLPPSLGGVCLPNGRSLSPPSPQQQHHPAPPLATPPSETHHNGRLSSDAGAVNNLVGIWEDKSVPPSSSVPPSAPSSSQPHLSPQHSRPARPKPPSRVPPQFSSSKPVGGKPSPHAPPLKPSTADATTKASDANPNFGRSAKAVLKQNSYENSPAPKLRPTVQKQDSASERLGGAKQPLLPPGPTRFSSSCATSSPQPPVTKAVPLTRRADAVFPVSSSKVAQRLRQFETTAQEKAVVASAYSDKAALEPARETTGLEESIGRRFSDSASHSNSTKPRSPVRSHGIKGRVPMRILQKDEKHKGQVLYRKKSADHFLISPDKPMPGGGSNAGSKRSPTSERAGAEKPAAAAYENITIKPSREEQKRHKRSNSDSKTVKLAVADNYENLTFEPQSQAPARPTVAPATSAPPQAAPQRRANYENVEVMTPAGLMTYTTDDGSDDEDTLFGGKPPGMEEVIYENFGPDPGNRQMTIDELAKHVECKGKKGLSTEYYKIRNEPLRASYMTCKLACNVPKNRYKDVICYDDTRVTLKPLPGSEGSDYIHANTVSGFNNPEAFILTQGPIKKTVLDFWRMVWEKEVAIIVMVTKCVELGKRKCEQYWPEEGVCMRYGNVSVQLSHTETSQDSGYQLRTLKVHCKGAERVIQHYQFLAWPDYGLPDRGDTVLQMLFDVRACRSRVQSSDSAPYSPRAPPILVHCSAGVGRSGVLCTLDHCIDELQEQARVNIQGYVRRLRMQRAYCIQTDEQYEFCYRTLLEYGRTLRSKR